jgi:chromosome partitioning protein
MSASADPAELGWPTSAAPTSGALGWPVSRETAPIAAEKAAERVDPDGSPSADVEVSRETPVPGPSFGPPKADQPTVSRETLSAGEWPPPATVPVEPESARTSAADPLAPDAARGDWPRPAETRLYTVANQKGGVGKTTSAVNLAASLAQHGARVLVVDLDPQGNATTAFGIEHRSGTPSIYDVLVDGRPIDEVAVAATGIPGLFCVPATIDLAGAEIELVSVVARETRLRKALAAMQSRYDYIFVDCPPSLGLLTVNALVAASEVLIPIQCEFYALEGLSQLLRNIDMVRVHLNADLHVATILLTMYDGRTRLAEQVAAEVRNHFGDLVLAATIPRSVRISEAPGYGQSVITYDPGSRGATAYAAAAFELANRASGNKPGETG